MTPPTPPKELPLTRASARGIRTGDGRLLRRQPGRPRKAENGQSAGTVNADTSMNSGQERSALACLAVAPLVPRVVDLRGACLYLGLGERRVRGLATAGLLRRVRLEGPNGQEIRKLLFQKAALDAYIDRCADDGRQS